tara:strand:- start:384 stop:923 length:540 start_codon:yes stop_codon:yes gene_type:complete
MSKRAALRYAKAVLDQARETGNTEKVYNDMTKIEATISSNKELRNFLNSPIIKNEDKRSALRQVFSDSSEATFSLIDILISNNRAGILNDVAVSFLSLYNEANGVVTAEVTTAVEMDAELEQKISNKVKSITGSDKVNIAHVIDADIIGGFILKVGDVQYDASIANKLDKVKKEFSKRL